MEGFSSADSQQKITSFLQNLEKRISRIESHLNLTQEDENIKLETPEIFQRKTDEEKEQLEFHIGQFWFAKMGIIVLAIGIAFLLTLPYKNLPPFAPSIIGYLAAVIMFVLSRAWKNSFNLISKYLFGSGLLLLYFSTMRLNYWGTTPAIASQTIELTLLSVVTVIHLYISFRQKSIYLFGIGLILGLLTSLLWTEPIIIFAAILILSFLSSYVKYVYEWDNIIFVGIALAFLTHLIWFMNNPLVGNKILLLNEPYYNVLFLLGYSCIFALGILLRKGDKVENPKIIAMAFLNSFGFLAIFSLINIAQFKDHLTLSFLIASIVYITLAILYWKIEESKYSTFFYSLIGYAALSIAIINQFDKPDLFIWLCWQSLLVVTTAIWFRSKIIIVANFIIYLMIVVASLIISSDSAYISLSIGAVALLSARILNFQKKRLDLQTELMRNAYLTVAFFSLPYAMYVLIPQGFVSFSWLGIAGLYYSLSVILKNKKYRWMALLTLVITIIYVLIVGIIQLESELRVLSFMVLGIVLISISIIYTKIKAKKTKKKIENL